MTQEQWAEYVGEDPEEFVFPTDHTEDRIYLKHTARGWSCVYEGPHAQAIEREFGTIEIMSALGPNAPAWRALELIQQHNPDVRVALMGS